LAQLLCIICRGMITGTITKITMIQTDIIHSVDQWRVRTSWHANVEGSGRGGHVHRAKHLGIPNVIAGALCPGWPNQYCISSRESQCVYVCQPCTYHVKCPILPHQPPHLRPAAAAAGPGPLRWPAAAAAAS
jgi:hypothetical protein